MFEVLEHIMIVYLQHITHLTDAVAYLMLVGR